MAIILKDITELPSGTATLANPIMFGIGELLHTTTLEDIKTLLLTGVITDIPPNKIKIVNVFPDANFSENWEIDQLFAVGQAINQTLTDFWGGEITTNPGERIVFRLIQSSYFEPEPGVLIPNVLWRYYSEVSGALSFTGISDPAGDLVPNGVIRNEPEDLIDLGDIELSTIESGFNTDPFAPFTMSGNTFILAIQDGSPKIWKWVGGDGLYGGVSTQAVSQNFLLLSQAPTDPIDYLPVKTIETTPYTLTFGDLNRPLHFTSDNQVVNIENTLVELAADVGLTLYDFIAYFSGTGTHVVNKNASPIFTGEQDDLVKGLCYDTSGTTLWTVQKWVKDGDIGVPTLQEVTDEGATTTNQITVASDIIVGKGGNPTGVTNRNTALGKNALLSASGLNNQTNNVGIGYESGLNMTSGELNTGVGADSLRQLTSGSGNTAIGFSALRSITTALNNTVLGFALRNITSGNDNVVIGASAGNHRPPDAGNPTLTSISDSILIGRSATVENNGLTNVIVIGKDVRTATSNTVILGNTNIVKTFLRGALSLIARTKASVTGLTAGLFIIDSGDANRPTIHNGTDWKGLAYRDEVVPSLETGTVISFANPEIYNSSGTPATTNITNDLTGALQGVVQKIYHNHTSAPTVPAGWVLMGAGTYTTSELNIIYAEFAGGSRVEYWTVQEQ